MMLAKIIRQTLSGFIVANTEITAVWFCCRGREIGLNAEYSQEKWEFTVKEQGRGDGG